MWRVLDQTRWRAVDMPCTTSVGPVSLTTPVPRAWYESALHVAADGNTSSPSTPLEDVMSDPRQRRRRMQAAVLAISMGLAAGVGAQDGVSVSGDYMSYAVPDYGSIALSQSILESTIEESSRDNGRSSDRRPAAARAANWSVTYDAAVSGSVRNEYLSNIRKLVGKERADAIGAHLAAEPVDAQFDRFAAPYGLKRSSLADVLAGYLALMWTTANHAPAPTPQQVLGLKRQIMSHGGLDLDVPDIAADRQRIAESVMYRVSQVATQRRIASQRGDTGLQQAIADSAHRMVRQTQGIDLRRMRLTAQGLERR